MLGADCLNCHKGNSWKENSFDHKSTKFELKGAHKKTSCSSCHPDQAWKDTSTKCISCHKINDIHGEIFGTKCEDCHSLDNWKNPHFDHNKTKFILEDKEKTLTDKIIDKTMNKLMRAYENELGAVIRQ